MIGRINWYTTPERFRRESATKWPDRTPRAADFQDPQWRARENSKRFRRTSATHTTVWACHMAGRGELEPAKDGAA